MDHGTDALDILFGRGKGRDSIYHQILKFVIQVPFFVKFESFLDFINLILIIINNKY